jgi:hypothetical protein
MLENGACMVHAAAGIRFGVVDVDESRAQPKNNNHSNGGRLSGRLSLGLRARTFDIKSPEFT